MKPTPNTVSPRRSPLKACLGMCRQILAQIRKARQAIYAEYREALQTHDHLLRLALNEAEALAWETKYPHLVFPTLAKEKLQAVADWKRHQLFVQRTNPVFATAN